MDPCPASPLPRAESSRSPEPAGTLRRVLYVSRIALPNRQAHSIQMVRSCHSLAREGVGVDFYARGTQPIPARDVCDYYGLEPLENLRVHWLAAPQWEGLRFVGSVLRHFRRRGPGTVLYTRDWHLARRFIRLRPLLRMPVVIETHKSDGYLETSLPAEPGGAEPGTTPLPPWSTRPELIEYAYRHASGVVCLSLDAFRAVSARYPHTPALRLWHGTDPVASAACDPAARSGILYAGNLYPHYRPEVLLDALKLLPGETLHVVGGNDEAQVAAFRRQAAERGVADRLVLHGFVPPGRMAGLLDRFRVGVTLLTGLKVADYLSHALPFVSPDLPVVRDVLRDGDTCLLFAPGNAASLAEALRRILGDPALACRLAAGALAEARLHAQPLRARRLIAFLESLL